MTWLATSRAGTGRPMSRAASWIASVMPAVESISVPSQSKTMKGYRLVNVLEIRLAKRQHILRQRRLQPQLLLARRVHQRQPSRVQEQALHALPRHRAIEFEIAVLVVAQHGVAGVRQV